MNKLKTCLIASLSSILLLTGCNGFFVVTPEDLQETTTQPVVTTRQFVETKPTIYSNFTSIKTSIGALELNLENPVLNKQEVTFDLDVKDMDQFSIDDIEIIIENPDIISVEFKELNATYLYFTVKGKIKGNTSFYLKSKDGAVISNSIKINVIGEYLMPEDPTPTPKPTPKSKKKKTTKKKVIPTPTETKEFTLDDFKTLVEKSINTKTRQCEVNIESNIIVINIVNDKALDNIVKLKNEEQDYSNEWNAYKISIQKLSSNIFISAKSYFKENTPTIQIKINDKLTVKNGIILEDNM